MTHAVYTGRTTSWTTLLVTGVNAVVLVLVATIPGGPWRELIVVSLLLIALGVLAEIVTASSVRATAGPNGFTIRWGWFGWPRCSYPLDRIARAEVIDLPWWRVSLGIWWTPRRTVCTVRSGPTVRLSLSNGRIVTVSVPEPAAAVAALHHAMGGGRNGERGTRSPNGE